MRTLFLQAKYRAKERGLSFTITEADIVVPDRCPVLGMPMTFARGAGGPRDASPSVDRIDASRGYDPGNVWVISSRANRIKNDATLAELEMLVAAMRALSARQQPSI